MKLNFLYFICNQQIDLMTHVFKFILLNLNNLYLKGTYIINKGSLKNASYFAIKLSQHINGFVPTTHTQIQI